MALFCGEMCVFSLHRATQRQLQDGRLSSDALKVPESDKTWRKQLGGSHWSAVSKYSAAGVQHSFGVEGFNHESYASSSETGGLSA